MTSGAGGGSCGGRGSEKGREDEGIRRRKKGRDTDGIGTEKRPENETRGEYGGERKGVGEWTRSGRSGVG